MNAKSDGKGNKSMCMRSEHGITSSGTSDAGQGLLHTWARATFAAGFGVAGVGIGLVVVPVDVEALGWGLLVVGVSLVMACLGQIIDRVSEPSQGRVG